MSFKSYIDVLLPDAAKYLTGKSLPCCCVPPPPPPQIRLLGPVHLNLISDKSDIGYRINRIISFSSKPIFFQNYKKSNHLLRQIKWLKICIRCRPFELNSLSSDGCDTMLNNAQIFTKYAKLCVFGCKQANNHFEKVKVLILLRSIWYLP